MQEWTLIVFIVVVISCLAWLWFRSRKKSRWESQLQNLVSLKKREKKEREKAIKVKQKRGEEIIKDFWPRVKKVCKRFAKHAEVSYQLDYRYSDSYRSSEWGNIAPPCVVLGKYLETYPTPEGIYVLEKPYERPFSSALTEPKLWTRISFEEFSEERLAEVLMRRYFKHH